MAHADDTTDPGAVFDEDAERAVLGAVMLNDACLIDLGELRPTDFYRESHRVIFRSILAVADGGGSVDLLSTMERLKIDGQVKTAGGGGYLSELSGFCPTASNAAYYADRVLAAARIREMQALARRVTYEAHKPHESVEAWIAGIASAAADLSMRSTTGELIKPLAEAMEQARAIAERLSEARANGVPDSEFRIPLPWPYVQECTGGLGAWLVFFSALRKSGKTTSALQIAAHAGALGVPGLIVSLEMPDEELGAWGLGHIGKVDRSRVARGDLDAAGWDRVNGALIESRTLPIYLASPRGMTIADIIRHAEANAARLGLRYVLVDYLELVDAVDLGRHATTEAGLSDTAKRMKLSARHSGLTWIVLAQLNSLGQMRGSRALENHCDLEIRLETEEREVIGYGRPYTMRSNLFRHGEPFKAHGHFIGSTGRFNEIGPVSDYTPNEEDGF